MKDAKEYLEEWCKENYPEHKQYVAKDTGEVCIMLLEPNDTFGRLWTWRVVYHNAWYTGMVDVYEMKPLKKEDV